jgi:mannan endo-1,4-beta-mannosidase
LLQIKNIPVVWRPLHEAAGNIYEYNGGLAWFWWGADGAESFKQLWIYMFEYFESQGLNNLIWVWTTQTKDDDFYPGDEYVDIIGRDIYDVSDASTISSQFISVQERYPTKMVTLSEFGSVAPISEQWSAGAKWSYFMPWYDYERTNNTSQPDFSSTDHEHANAAWWQNAFDQNYVITLDQMPSLK